MQWQFVFIGRQAKHVYGSWIKSVVIITMSILRCAIAKASTSVKAPWLGFQLFTFDSAIDFQFESHGRQHSVCER